MLLKSLHIKSHRGLEELDLFDLSPVSLIVGSNNSGKSSILEAIALLLRPLDPSQWVQAARQRDTDTDLADGLWSIFRSQGMLRLEAPQQSKPTEMDGELPGERRTLNVRAVAMEDWDAEEAGAARVQVSVKINDQPSHDLVFRRGVPAQWYDSVHLYRCFTITPITHRSSRALVEHLSRVVDEGDKTLALEMLQLFDPRVRSLDVSGGRRRQTIVVKHGERGVVDLASFGDGMRRVTALALALSRAQGGVLLIDELEAGIHPTVLEDVLQKLLAAASAAGVQIVATTHSLEAVDALIAATTALDAPDILVGYYVAQTNGKRSIRRYAYERLRALREGGVDLR